MKIIVCGLAGSGSRWARQMLHHYPGLPRPQHFSFPIHDAQWPAFEQANKSFDKVLVMMRDLTCASLSCKRREFDKFHGCDHQDTVGDMRDQIDLWIKRKGPTNVVFASYEGLVAHGWWYWYRVLESLGLDPQRCPRVLVIPRDENRKYMNGNYTRQPESA